MLFDYTRLEDRMLEPDIHFQTTRFVRSLFLCSALLWIGFDSWYSIIMIKDSIQCFFGLMDICLHQLFIILIWIYYRKETEPVILKKPFYALFVGRSAWFLLYTVMNVWETHSHFQSIPQFAYYFLTMLSMSFWIALFCSLA